MSESIQPANGIGPDDLPLTADVTGKQIIVHEPTKGQSRLPVVELRVPISAEINDAVENSAEALTAKIAEAQAAAVAAATSAAKAEYDAKFALLQAQIAALQTTGGANPSATISGAATTALKSATFLVGFAATSEVWVALEKGGVLEGVRIRMTAPGSITLTPQFGGSYRAVVYSTQSGGAMLDDTDPFTVAEQPAAIVLPAITFSPAQPSFSQGTPVDTPVVTLSAVPSGATRTKTTDTRLKFNLDKTQLLIGSGASVVGTSIPEVVTDTYNDTTANPPVAPVSVPISVGVTAADTEISQVPNTTILAGFSRLRSSTAYPGSVFLPTSTTTGSKVSSIPNQLGTGPSFTQSNAAYQPSLVAATTKMGGKDCIDFLGNPSGGTPTNTWLETDDTFVPFPTANGIVSVVCRWHELVSAHGHVVSFLDAADDFYYTPGQTWRSWGIANHWNGTVYVAFAAPAGTTTVTQLGAVPYKFADTSVIDLVLLNGKANLRITTASGTVVGPQFDWPATAVGRPGRMAIGKAPIRSNPSSTDNLFRGFFHSLVVNNTPASEALVVDNMAAIVGVPSNLQGKTTGGTGGTTGGTGTTTGGGEVVAPPSTGTFSSISAADFEAFPYTTFAKTSPGTTTASVLFPPTVPQASGANDVVGFNVAAGSRTGFASRIWDTGCPLPAGLVTPTDRLEAVIGGTTYPVQMDVLTKHPVDGSVFLPSLTFPWPALSANGSVGVMIRKGAPTNSAANVTFDNLDNFPFTGRFVLVSSRPGETTASTNDVVENLSWTVNFGSLLAAAKAAGPLNYWEQGPYKASVRLIQTFKYALRMVADVTKFSNGTYRVDVQFCADLQRWANPSNFRAWTVNASLSQNGSEVHSVNNMLITFGKVWRKVLFSGDSVANNALQDPPEPFVQFDFHAIKRWGILPNWQTESDGVSATGGAMTGITAKITNTNFRKPLSNNGMNTSWGATGGQDYIGLQTVTAAAYWMTGREDAFRSMLGYGEIGANWNFHDPQYGEAFSARRYPGMVIQWNQTGTQPSNTTMYGQPSAGWALDLGHHPEPYFSPWIATGRRFFADRLEAAAAFQINVAYTRNKFRDTVIIANDQVREAGWKIRSIGLAAYGLPDRYTLKPYFVTVINDNCDWITSRMASWKTLSGEVHGYLRQSGGGTILKMWQNEHVYSSLGWLAKLGFKRVKPLFTNFFGNLAWGRFLHNPPLDPRNTVIYQIEGWGDQNDNAATIQTWAAWQNLMVTSPKNYDQSNGFTSHSTDGNWSNYLPNRTLSILCDVFPNDTSIRQARTVFLSYNPPYYSDINNRRGGEIYDNISPLTKV